MPVRNAIGRITSILCIPYGYTVTLWCAGALAVTKFGLPTVPDVVLFALGAVVAFVTLAAVGGPHLDAEVPMRVPWIVVINVLPIVVTLMLLVVPNEVLGRRLGFLAASLVATGAYVLGLAVMIRIVAPGDETPSASDGSQENAPPNETTPRAPSPLRSPPRRSSP